MKLQRNNKYLNRITAGLGALLISASLLAGCVEESIQDVKSTEIVEVTEPIKETPLVRDEKYYLNYYKLSNEEINNAKEKNEIKYPDALWRMNQVNTIVVKNENDENLKVIMVEEVWDRENNIIHFFHLFTEEHLFDMPISGDYKINEYTEIQNYDFSKMTNAIPFFDKNKVVKYGLCVYPGLFVSANIKELREKYGVSFIDPSWEPVYTLFPRNSFNSLDEFHTTIEMFIYYESVTLPENRITGEEMGLSVTYREEDKYKDYWKISEEEIQSRLNNYKIESPDAVINANGAQTLVLKDANGKYKVLNTVMVENGNMQEFYDLYSKLYLFSLVSNGSIAYDSNSGYSGFNFNSVTDMIPYFKDKTFVKLDILPETNYLVEDYIKELSEKDGINYNYPEDGLTYVFYPTGEYSTGSINHTVKDYLRNYVQTSFPGTQVTYNELIVGLEKEEINKVLVK